MDWKIKAQEWARKAYDPMENREMECDPLRVQGYLAGVRAGLEAAELMLKARQDEISDATAHNTINGCISRLRALMPETKDAT